jgi:Phage gp6-like head-tail connector protein
MSTVLGSTGFIILTPPSSEPLTLTDVKDWLNVDFAEKDTLISKLITRARRRGETLTGRALASQQIQATYPITRPQGGELSGPIDHGPDWYQYQEALGANPFGAAMFYFDLPMAPCDVTQVATVETKITAFDKGPNSGGYTTFLTGAPSTFTTAWIDNNQEPARFYFQDPLTANFWRFTYWAGYSPTTFPLPEDLAEPMLELISTWYDWRDGSAPANQIQQIEGKFLSKRLSTAWI